MKCLCWLESDRSLFSLRQVFLLSVPFHPVDGGEESHHPEGLGAADDQPGQGEDLKQRSRRDADGLTRITTCLFVPHSWAWWAKCPGGRRWTWTCCSSTLKFDEHNSSATRWMRWEHKPNADFPDWLWLFRCLSSSSIYSERFYSVNRVFHQ